MSFEVDEQIEKLFEKADHVNWDVFAVTFCKVLNAGFHFAKQFRFLFGGSPLIFRGVNRGKRQRRRGVAHRLGQICYVVRTAQTGELHR